MIKRFAFIVLLAVVFDSCHRKEASTTQETADTSKPITTDTSAKKTILDKYPLLTWLRKNPAEIGCILQTEIGYRDSVFTCNYKNYSNNSSPCDDEAHYYEGVELPDSLASKINPAFQQFAMDFEHGELQQLAITFADSMPISDVEAMLHLPLNKNALPENVMDIDCGEKTSSKTKLVVITGFEHMGSGDVDCN
jgi:hypothetical protein